MLNDIELIVVDNHPQGACSEPLKQSDKNIRNYRYVPRSERTGTCAKEYVFEAAIGKFVLCIDSHALIAPGGVKRLLDYIDAHPFSDDLLQGPLLFDDLKKLATHLNPEWRGGFFGRWALDERGIDIDAPPFEIPMQGTGLLACRKETWPGLNPAFRGFGGEGWYLNEKFRQRGGRTLCLPFLRWLHRFNRPLGVPYHNSWSDRVRNYLIGFEELGLPTDTLKAHFMEFLGPAAATAMFQAIERERSQVASSTAPSLESISTAC